MTLALGESQVHGSILLGGEERLTNKKRPMDIRRSLRLKLALNDSGKQRLNRFIRRNLHLIENNICVKRSNSVKNRTKRNSKNMERVEIVEKENPCNAAEDDRSQSVEQESRQLEPNPMNSTASLKTDGGERELEKVEEENREKAAEARWSANSMATKELTIPINTYKAEESQEERTFEETTTEEPDWTTTNSVSLDDLTGPASPANSIISIPDSDSSPEGKTESSSSETEEDTRQDLPTISPPEHDEPVESTSYTGKTTTGFSIIGTNSEANCRSSRGEPNMTEKHLNFQSDESSNKSSNVGRKKDLGLDTLKRTMIELFTTDSVSMLPLISRNWPEKFGGNPTKKLPDPKRTQLNDTSGFLCMLDLKANRYFVQCKLDDAEWEIMNYVARRWNWTSDLELSQDTKYVIVKEESINEELDGIPENAMMANASGGCVLLFNYIQECAAEDEQIHIREDHVPSHQGVRRKMLGREYSTSPMFKHYGFYITPELSTSGRDYALLRNLLQLTRSKLYGSLRELRSSTAIHKVALRSTAVGHFDDVTFVHYHWLYECLLHYKLYSLEPYACDFTAI
ncbi:hypothetical protein GE061_007642 [Apolygus lucorum]|uniref:Uncharacterized protein n=1 Tax=Apolygus lucorum TaxID=248454 RepID=A0A6A4IVV4_APOLU|nr:hypothetical protein GE061_007642 [Apolygus lucorum]